MTELQATLGTGCKFWQYYAENGHMNVQEYKSSTFLDHVTLRFLNNDDIGDLKKLCLEWFPLR